MFHRGLDRNKTLNKCKPVPKVIDFGIAKATSGERLTDLTVFPAYEQVSTLKPHDEIGLVSQVRVETG